MPRTDYSQRNTGATYSVLPRRTKQKEAIRSAFQAAGRPLSPEEVLEIAKRTIAGLGLSTVYRAIFRLSEERVLTLVQVPGQGNHYELSNRAHHHHFRCEVCRRLFALQGCGVKKHSRLPRGMRAEGPWLLVRGICADCRVGLNSQPER